MQMDVKFTVTENGKNAPGWSVDADTSGNWTLERLLVWSKATLISVAYEALREEQARGFDKNPMVAVDGNLSKPVQNVNPLGKIEMHSRMAIDPVLTDTFLSLMRLSPVDTGLYKDNHLVLYNKIPIASTFEGLQAWVAANNYKIKKGDVFRFVDIVPYARKLETEGITMGRHSPRLDKSTDKKKRSGIYVLVPNGTYYLTFRNIQRKYKTAAFIKFEWVNGSDLAGVQFPTATYKGKRLRRTFSPMGKWGKGNRPYNYPSIKITIGMGSL